MTSLFKSMTISSEGGDPRYTGYRKRRSQPSTWTSILFAVGAIFGVLVLYKWFKSYVTGSPIQLPSYKVSLLSYIMCFRKFNTSPVHPLSLLLEYFCAIAKIYEKEGIFYMWFGYKPFIFAYKSEIVKAILCNPDSKGVPLEKMMALRSITGDGLLLSEGKKWRRNRTLINPAFHTRILENYMPSFNEGSRRLVNKLKVFVNQPWVDLWPLFIVNSLDLICKTAMGVKTAVDEDNPVITSVIKSCKIVHAISVYRMFRPWTFCDTIFSLFPSSRKLNEASDVFHTFCKKIIREKMDSLSDDKANANETDQDNDILRKKQRTFLEHLLAYHMNNPEFTLEDVQNEVYTAITAGHETVSSALNWAVYMFGVSPHFQEKVVQELNCIFGDDYYRDVTYEDLKNMTYLESFIKEVLRLYPPVPIFPLKFKENKEIGNYIIPKDVTCVIFPYMLHRNPESFPNPEVFDPERFSPENCSTRHPYSYLPFSMGERNCIGSRFAMMELKIVLSHLLRYFKFTSLDPRDKISPKFATVLSNSGPLRIQLASRTRT
ncbi:cytochrome P450 4C1-like [Stegodyphus dumicola]|uniref:cytochrome P450 4C1-like n=1 Tax=Stegodyphus dumicola TaxID=202533 RepID=UPI0015B23BBE|nr:cytochrome P450 4C1-like [Stegodyphus dumicola]